MAVFIPDVFSGFLKGMQAANAENWQDLLNYNTVLKGQLENAMNMATFDPATRNVWNQARVNEINTILNSLSADAQREYLQALLQNRVPSLQAQGATIQAQQGINDPYGLVPYAQQLELLQRFNATQQGAGASLPGGNGATYPNMYGSKNDSSAVNSGSGGSGASAQSSGSNIPADSSGALGQNDVNVYDPDIQAVQQTQNNATQGSVQRGAPRFGIDTPSSSSPYTPYQPAQFNTWQSSAFAQNANKGVVTDTDLLRDLDPNYEAPPQEQTPPQNRMWGLPPIDLDEIA